jgi:hypothetical protein
MASTINTNIVKLRTSSNGYLPFKANDYENNHMWGYQGWEDLEWWTCARAKENYDYEAPMTSSLSNCTWSKKEWKFRLLTTWHPSLHFYFSFTWFIPLISFLPLLFSLFLLFFNLSFILSYTYFYFSLLFFLSFPYTYFFLYFPSLDIFFSLSKALNSSLSCMHTIWILNKNHARDETKLWK